MRAVRRRCAAGVRDRGYFSFAELISGELADRALGMTAVNVRLLAAVSAPSEAGPDIGVAVVAHQPFGLVIDLVERLLAAGAPGAVELAGAVAGQATGWKVKPAFSPKWDPADLNASF